MNRDTSGVYWAKRLVWPFLVAVITMLAFLTWRWENVSVEGKTAVLVHAMPPQKIGNEHLDDVCIYRRQSEAEFQTQPDYTTVLGDKPGTLVWVVKLEKASAFVRILDGKHEGASGWVRIGDLKPKS